MANSHKNVAQADAHAPAVHVSTHAAGGSDPITGAIAPTTIELGHASDTTIARASAGNLTVEGNALYRAGGTDVAVADGGTGASTKAAGFDALQPMTTSGDIIYGGASGTGTRLAKGTDGQVLTLASGLPSWATGGAGAVATDAIWDAKGDLAGGTGANTAAVLTVGSNGKVLTADSTQTTGLIWATPASGGAAADSIGTYFRYPLDRASLDGTYGDEFEGASLNGRWTRHVQGSGEETYQAGGRASILRVVYSNAAAARYIYQTAPNGTNETWECSLSAYQLTQTGQMYCLLMVDTSGNGVAAMMYDNGPGLFLANIASHGYSSALTSAAYYYAHGGGTNSNGLGWGKRYWLKLRKATGLYGASFSVDGENYSPEITGTPSAFTPARVGVGRVLGTTAGDTVDWHWFDKTA